MARYVLVPAAREDLEGILDSIAEGSVTAALRVLNRFEELFLTLARYPGLGQQRDDLTDLPLRFFPIYTYHVIYRVEAGRIAVIRILSMARDLPTLLERGEP